MFFAFALFIACCLLFGLPFISQMQEGRVFTRVLFCVIGMSCYPGVPSVIPLAAATETNVNINTVPGNGVGVSNNSNSQNHSGDEAVDLAVLANVHIIIAGEEDLLGFIRVENLGGQNASQVTLEAIFPEEFTLTSIDAPCATGFPCDLGDMAGGEAIFIGFVFSVPSDAAGQLKTTATVSSIAEDVDPTNNTSTSVNRVVRRADLELNVEAPATVVAGKTFVMHFTATNHGPSDQVDVTVVNPSDIHNLVKATSPCESGLPCELGYMSVGSTISFDLEYEASEFGMLSTFYSTYRIEEYFLDPEPLNNFAEVAIPVRDVYDIAVSKRSFTSHVEPGGNTIYRITVKNQGPTSTEFLAFDVIDEIPAGLTGVRWTCRATGGGAIGGYCHPEEGSGDVDLFMGLPVGGIATIDVMATVEDIAEGASIINQVRAIITPETEDPQQQNNIAEDRDTVALFADGLESGS